MQVPSSFFVVCRQLLRNEPGLIQDQPAVVPSGVRNDPLRQKTAQACGIENRRLKLLVLAHALGRNDDVVTGLDAWAGRHVPVEAGHVDEQALVDNADAAGGGLGSRHGGPQAASRPRRRAARRW